MSPRHHLNDEWLFSYAVGGTTEPTDVLIASHLTLCPHCRNIVREAEDIGGGLFSDLAPEPMGSDALSLVLSRLDAADSDDSNAVQTPSFDQGNLPQPILHYMDADVETVAWRWVAKGVWEHRLLQDRTGTTLRLYRIAPGTSLPEHGHRGQELTLILTGAYNDQFGRFARGDIADLGIDAVHKPVTEKVEECIALAVNEAPIRLTGPVGRLVEPFLRS
ncbi:MAG: ChrR family anti-sigma-E factor [Proteobacteria bacterium]|nr:ChrR family anti-sigma-E factor [Pseudomonadota bacterium]